MVLSHNIQIHIRFSLYMTGSGPDHPVTESTSSSRDMVTRYLPGELGSPSDPLTGHGLRDSHSDALINKYKHLT